MTTRAKPSSLPEIHAEFISDAIERLAEDPRLVGVGVGGSYLTDTMDEFSDVDLVIGIEPEEYEVVMNDRHEIAESLGPLLAGFTGEHVGEPRLLICLYGSTLLHVDLKFISLEDARDRVEDPTVLWERDKRFTSALEEGKATFPQPDLQWIEDRFWVWVHYGAAKIGRRELFEAIDFLSFLRGQVLGPLTLMSQGERPTGVRRLEASSPELARELECTVPDYDSGSCLSALENVVDLYRRLRRSLRTEDLRTHGDAEDAAVEYLKEIRARI